MIVHCDRCHRELKSPKHVELRMGPVCLRKTKAERERAQAKLESPSQNQ